METIEGKAKGERYQSFSRATSNYCSPPIATAKTGHPHDMKTETHKRSAYRGEKAGQCFGGTLAKPDELTNLFPECGVVLLAQLEASHGQSIDICLSQNTRNVPGSDKVRDGGSVASWRETVRRRNGSRVNEFVELGSNTFAQCESNNGNLQELQGKKTICKEE